MGIFNRNYLFFLDIIKAARLVEAIAIMPVRLETPVFTLLVVLTPLV
ncbi:MAG: hypothetical protein E6706_04600 [Anaerococcus hydrogenalis]|nr:hypothetical protein [Anaerococcus hydrogenalis]